MKKNKIITKKQLEEQIQEIKKTKLDEVGVGRGIKNFVSGVKGIFKGEGYSYYSFLSTLHGMVRNLRRYDIPNVKVLNNMYALITQINASKMNNTKKTELINNINNAINGFNNYSNIIKNIETTAFQELNANRAAATAQPQTGTTQTQATAV